MKTRKAIVCDSIYICEGKCKFHAPQHTPTPWKLEGNLEISGPPEADIYDYRFIALADSQFDQKADKTPEQEQTDRANAAFIVRAVNAHEELLEALKQLANISNRHSKNSVVASIVEQAWKAIAKAEDR